MAPGTVLGDHPEAIYRWLPADSLAALGRAECGRDTERVLPDEWRRCAYDVWDAKQDIIEHWQIRTDPQNLQPSIPKPMRDAVQLLEEWGPLPTSRSNASMR